MSMRLQVGSLYTLHPAELLLSYLAKSDLVHNPSFSPLLPGIMSGVATSYVVAHYAAPNLAISYIAAVFLGVFMALIGTAVQHDANHGSFHPNPRVNYIAGMSIDLVGKSSHNWKL